MGFSGDRLTDYYNYRIYGPEAYHALGMDARHAGEFLDICEAMPPHRLRFSLMTNTLAHLVDTGRGNLSDIFRAQRFGKKLLDHEDILLKDYTQLVTNPQIIKAFEPDHQALDFFLGLSALEIEEEALLAPSHSPLTGEQRRHNEKIETLLNEARQASRNGAVKSLLKEKITPFFLNSVAIRQAAKAIHEKLCLENCCDNQRQRLQQLSLA